MRRRCKRLHVTIALVPARELRVQWPIAIASLVGDQDAWCRAVEEGIGAIAQSMMRVMILVEQTLQTLGELLVAVGILRDIRS